MKVVLENILIEFFATFLIFFLIGGLIVLWFIDGKIKKEQVVHALAAVFIAYLIAVIIKHLFPTLRPYITNGREVEILFKPADGAFPSGHTAEAFALAVTIFMHDRRVGWFFLTGAMGIGIARVLANVHYPIDIVGGALLGTLVAVIVEKTHFTKIFSSKKTRPRS